MIRLFVAINFNPDTRSRIVSIQDEMCNRSQRGNFALPENLHLTLAFIGDVSPKKIDKIKAILETVTFEPFDVSVERLGIFSRGTLWWAGLRKDEPLMLLQREIEYKLAICGFEMDGRKYSPHVTLGREVVTDAVPWEIEPFGETVSKVDLMKSERVGGKLTYTEIYSKESWESK